MIEIGRSARSQAPPQHIVFEALTHPDRDPARPWLALLDDERRPDILTAEPPDLVVWSSLWIKRMDAQVRFVVSEDGAGSRVGWSLWVDEPAPEAALVGHLRGPYPVRSAGASSTG